MAMSTKEQIHGAKGVFHPCLPTPGKQPAAVQAPGSSEGCPATGSCFVCLKEELCRNYKALLLLDEGKDFVAHGFALAN